MKIHEYQAKAILAEFGVPVPRGRVAVTPPEAAAIARELGGTVVVKAQIHAGGRGKGGGVKLAKSPEAAQQAASQILGMMLKTHQTGPDGQKVKRVLVEEGMDIRQELYLGIVIDRKVGLPAIMGSSAGGVEIEEVARTRPDAIVKVHVDPATGVKGFPPESWALAWVSRETSSRAGTTSCRSCIGPSPPGTAPWLRSIPW
jgi:succinyl-CoA synthetase beta subunit